MRVENHTDAKWRIYQKKLKRERRMSSVFKRLPYLAAIGCLGALAVVGLYAVFEYLNPPSPSTSTDTAPRQAETMQAPAERREGVIRPDLFPELLAGIDFCSPGATTSFPFKHEGYPFLLKTTIDPDLQSYILRLFQKSKTIQAAAVVIRPGDGRVLSMASYDSEGGGENICVRSDYPAASIFKVVAAAAALENAGLALDDRMRYEGGRYTLYRRQLKEQVGRNAHEIDFRKAFALSINPVFGRVGIYELGKESLDAYADRFLFRNHIPFEIPLPPSSIEVPEHDFGLAEVASGFNKTTCISPLHAALISCAVVNNGVIMTPRLVDSVVDGQGEIVYRSEPAPLATVVEPKTADGLRMLMRETVLSGTGRNSFSKLLRSNIYRGIEVGAKTGSINDVTGCFRLDWVIAFADPKEGREPICVSVLSVHGDYLGVRAGDLARLIIARYYS
ncbi:MAG: penicillin-binding transpeptidase domain-containing protein [Desulfatiglandaceae bacterium]